MFIPESLDAWLFFIIMQIFHIQSQHHHHRYRKGDTIISKPKLHPLQQWHRTRRWSTPDYIEEHLAKERIRTWVRKIEERALLSLPCVVNISFPGKLASWIHITYAARATGRLWSCILAVNHAAFIAWADPIPIWVHTTPPISVRIWHVGWKCGKYHKEPISQLFEVQVPAIIIQLLPTGTLQRYENHAHEIYHY